MATGVAFAYAGVLWLQWLWHRPSADHSTGGESGFVEHWLRDATLAAPVVVAAVWAMAWWQGRRGRSGPGPAGTALASSGALAAGAPAHAWLFESPGSPLLLHTGEVFVTVLPLHLLLAAVGAAAPTVWRAAAECGRRLVPGRPVRSGWRVAGTGTVAFSLAFAGVVLPEGQSEALAADGDSVCPPDARIVTYDIAAFSTVIPLNGWGDKLPSGLMYGLKGADARVGKTDVIANPNLTQPLVVRANVGDCVRIELRNDIRDRRVGLHPDGLVRFDPRTSDGARVGENPDTTVGTDEHVTYTWYADRQGEAPILDLANVHEDGHGSSTVARGLYGAVVVHPRDSTWHHPVTGEELLDQATGRAVETHVFADIHTDDGTGGYRSFAIVFLDENEGANPSIVDRDGNTPTFPSSGLEDATFGVNYRSEPLRNRLRAVKEHRDGETITLPSGATYGPDDPFCDGWVDDPEHEDGGYYPDDPGAACLGEEMHLQSWPFGDAGKLTRILDDGTVVVDSDLLIPKAYRGDPVRMSVVHPGVKETHPFHLHTQRWFADPGNPDSPRKDVESLGPGEAYPFYLEGGAGGLQGTVGDSIFHCHLYPHFAQGFWGNMRVFDRLRDERFGQTYPDGTPIETLQPLPGRTPNEPDADHPGFPLFVEGQVGQRAYRLPHAVVADDFAELRRPGDTIRGPSELEARNMPGLDPEKPGAGVIDPCPAGAPERTYRPHAVDVPIRFNSDDWTDPEGRIYVEEAHLHEVLAGEREPEPYTIRSIVGECVQVLTTNSLHLDDDPDVPIDRLNKHDGDYMSEHATAEVSTHVHLVQFDQQGSDGTSVGWNYVQAAMPGQTYGYRWYVDQPLRTIFFHDHQYAAMHQQKGLYAAMNVEPLGSTWHDPATGEELDRGVGTVADIRVPDGTSFRELSVFYSDRVPMWRDGGDGRPVNPPPAVDDFGAEQGGVALNYRNEPFQIRTNPNKAGQAGDPAYIYSSVVHGDPSTPLFRAYHGDPVIVRHMIGSHEEYHTFNLHGHRWLNQPDNEASEWTDHSQGAIGEYFNYEVHSGPVWHQPRPRPDRGEARAAQAPPRRGNRGDGVRRAQGPPEWAADTANGIPALVEGGAGPPGDYLYGDTPLDWQWLGMWGIFRVPAARVDDLQPLPGRPAPGPGRPWPALSPADNAARPAPRALDTCPADAPVRDYEVVAIQREIVYNEVTGDRDPHGLLYVLAEDEQAVREGDKPAEPLFLRANAGDCLRVTLTNALPPEGLPDHDDLDLWANAAFPKSARVSLHAGMVDYDVTRADGATVGYNYDQTVAPGDSLTAYWHVPDLLEGSSIPIADFADRRGHRHHGLHGGLLVEPEGSTWSHPETGEPLTTGAQAVISWSDEEGNRQVTREWVIDWQNGLSLRDADGTRLPDAADVEDPHDMGTRGVNYRTERFLPRLEADPEHANVFSSAVHGDPATPIFEAYPGDPVRLRLLHGSDRSRVSIFVLSGHAWHRERRDPYSEIASAHRTLPGQGATLDLLGGAGGVGRLAGDYLYRDGNLLNQTNQGLWGLARVNELSQARLLPLDAFPADPASPSPTPAESRPSTPVLDPDSDSGEPGDGITNVRTPTFTGTARDGDTVELLVRPADDDDAPPLVVGSAAAVGGSYRLTTDELADGRYAVRARARGLESGRATTITVDTAAPTDVAFLGGPEDGAAYPPAAVPAAPTCAAEYGLSGPGSCVVTGYARSVGSHTMQALATDLAGNDSAVTATYVVQAGSAATRR